MANTPRRYDIGPLVAAAVADLGPGAFTEERTPAGRTAGHARTPDQFVKLRVEPNWSKVAATLGMDRAEFTRSRQRGSVCWFVADRAAVAIGLHPAVLWPSWFDDSLADCTERNVRLMENERARRARKQRAA